MQPVVLAARHVAAGQRRDLVQLEAAALGVGGPQGVGDAVNQSVVITFMLLFAINFILTAIYFQVIPQKGS